MGKIGRGSKAGESTRTPESGEGGPGSRTRPAGAPEGQRGTPSARSPARGEEGDGFVRGEARPGGKPASDEGSGLHRPRHPDSGGALAPRGGARRGVQPDEMAAEGYPKEGRDYRIPRLPEDLKAGKISFQVLVGDQSYDITCAGPVSIEELHQVAENVSRTAHRLQGSGIPDFKKAKFNPNGDIAVDKPVLDQAGILGTEVVRVTESPEGPGRVKALLLRADGTVAVAGLGLARGPERALNRSDGDHSPKAGDPGAGDLREPGEKSAAPSEPVLADGFVSGQLAHVGDPEKRGAEERESLAYTRLDSVLSASGAALATDSTLETWSDFRAFLQGALGAEGAGDASLRERAISEARRLVGDLPRRPARGAESAAKPGEDPRAELREQIERARHGIGAKRAHLLIASAGLLEGAPLEEVLGSSIEASSSEAGFETLGEFVRFYEGEETTHLGAASEGFWEKNWKILQLREALLALGGE